MDLDRLAKSPVGTLVKISGWDPRFDEEYEHAAFVPSNLPDELHLSPSTYEAVVEASKAIVRADQAAAVLPNPMLLARPATRREAVSTSALEGTYAALSDVLEADFRDASELTSSVLEVRNYVDAAEHAYEWVRDGRPITRGLLCDLQKTLVRGTRAESQGSGQVRDRQVFIGAEGRRVAESRFVPPPPGDQLDAGLAAWEEWLANVPAGIPLVARIALAHYQFESLHPFVDGNGRLGRLVAALQMLLARDLRVPIVNVSPWLEQRRSAYQDGLLAVSCTGDWDPWVSFIAEAIRAQAQDALSRVERLLALRADYSTRLRAVRAKGVSLRIAEELIGYPMITATLASQVYDVSYQAANQAIARLVSLDILRQRGAGNYDRIFGAPEVLRIIED
jgi:Fic family protein